MKFILKIAIAFVILFNADNSLAQNCIEVESILVDACASGQTTEGLNEMFRFRVGDFPINISDIQVVNGWPSEGVNTLIFAGFVQNNFTVSKTIEMNATITSGCGYLLEPPNGIIPANRRVLAVTSYELEVNFNSFANLTDTLFIIFHQHSGQQGGHFLNQNFGAPQEQTLRIQINGNNPCFESVTYLRTDLVDVNGGNNPQDGATVRFTNDGIPSYSNAGCLAPFSPFSAEWTNPGAFCESSAPVDLNTYITGTTGGTWSGQGVSGSIFNPSGLNGLVEITYTVIPTNGCGGVPASVTQTVSISTSVDATFTNPGIICAENGNINLNTLITGTPGGVFIGSGVSGNQLNVSGQNGDFFITYLVGSGSCQDSETQLFSILNLSVPVVTGQTIYCGDEEVQILQATSDSGSIVNWFSDIALSNLLQSGSTFLPQNSSTEDYYVNQSQNGCTSDSVLVSIEFSTISAPQTDTLLNYCIGEPIPIATATSDGIINWYDDQNLTNLINTGNTFQSVNGNDTLYITSTVGSCVSEVVQIIILEEDLLVAEITSANGTSLCQGLPIELSSNEADLNEWNTGLQSQSISVTVAGTYTLTRTGLCNTATDEIEITGLPISVEIVTDVDSGFTTLPVSVNTISINAENCTWYLDSVIIDFSSPGIINFPDSGSYELKLICTNSTGCADTSVKIIKVKSDKLSIIVPNVFSPNGDSFNDLFKVKHNAVKTFNAQIFNRWGKSLYLWNDVENGWDGTLNGEKITDGTYFYLITGTDLKDKEFVEKGTVLLIGN